MAYQNNNHFVWFCKRKSGKFGKKLQKFRNKKRERDKNNNKITKKKLIKKMYGYLRATI